MRRILWRKSSKDKVSQLRIFPHPLGSNLVYIHLAAYDNLVLVNAKVENCGCCPGGKSLVKTRRVRSLFPHYIPLRALGCWQNKHFARWFNQTQRGIEIRPARSGIKIIQIDDPAFALCLHSANIDAVLSHSSLVVRWWTRTSKKKMFWYDWRLPPCYYAGDGGRRRETRLILIKMYGRNENDLNSCGDSKKKGESRSFWRAEEQHRRLKWTRANYIWTHLGCAHQHADINWDHILFWR